MSWRRPLINAYPGALPWHRSWVVTGRSAKWLYKLGFIKDGEASFEDITRRSDIQPLVKSNALLEANAFDDAWRAALSSGEALSISAFARECRVPSKSLTCFCATSIQRLLWFCQIKSIKTKRYRCF